MSPYLIDLSERVGATAAEAGLALAITELSSLPMWWAPLLIPALAAAKGGLAGFLGRKDTAAMLPARTDPASRL